MRIEGWERRLYALIESARHEAYIIGKHDCALFAIKAVEVVTGVDYSERVRGKYKTVRGSLRLVSVLSKGKGLEGAVTKIVGIESVGPLFAQRGEPMLYIEDTGGEHLGICVGDKCAVLAEDGLQFVSITDCKCCWRVCSV